MSERSVVACGRCCFFTFGKDLWDLGMAGAEGAVNLKAICIIQEGAAQREEHFLWGQSQANEQSLNQMLCWTGFVAAGDI